MKVKEFIEWLQTQPQDAIVEVLQHHRGHGYYDQGGNCSTAEFEIDCAAVGENYVISDYYDVYEYQKETYLFLGGKDL